MSSTATSGPGAGDAPQGLTADGGGGGADAGPGAQEALRPLRRHGDAHLHVPFCPDTPDARC